MASGNGTQQGGDGGQGRPGTGGNNPGQFTWNGGSAAGTFDPKTFGTQIFGDLAKAYKQGPQGTIPSYNPFTTQTRGLIDQGLAQVGANAGGPLANVAGGGWLGGNANPYFEQNLATTRANTLNDLGGEFQSFGRFGGGSMIDTATQALANSENAARSNNFNDEWNRMLGAQGALNANTATGLGYSGLLDSKNAELIKSQQEQQAMKDPFNYAAKYLGLLNSGTNAENTNKPLSFWDILGGIGSVAGAIL